jgi:hypothetical protein
MKLINFCSIFVDHFAQLDPDPDCDSDQIRSGSTTLPEPETDQKSVKPLPNSCCPYVDPHLFGQTASRHHVREGAEDSLSSLHQSSRATVSVNNMKISLTLYRHCSITVK